MENEKQIRSCSTAVVSVEIEIEADLRTTWESMVGDIGSWWRSDFLICEESKGMTLEPRVGGLLRERTAKEGCGYAWGQIIWFQPETHLAYLAQIVPPWGRPAQSVVQIALAEMANGRTKLTLTDAIIDNLTDEFLESLDEGWRQLYGEGVLKSYVESKGGKGV